MLIQSVCSPMFVVCFFSFAITLLPVEASLWLGFDKLEKLLREFMYTKVTIVSLNLVLAVHFEEFSRCSTVKQFAVSSPLRGLSSEVPWTYIFILDITIRQIIVSLK